MIQQNINIREIGWNLRIFYCPKTRSQCSYILQRLFDSGCTGKNYRSATALLNSGAYNIGLTYSNKANRDTTIVIGRASDFGEFVNTLTHEINHFIEHVMEALNVKGGTEDEAYFTGELFELLYRDAVHNVMPLL